MNWSGADMRCPQCNQYLPDRCTCNGPSKAQQILAGITVTLDALSLYSKWGFSDGDLLSDAFHAMRITDIRQREVLAQLIEERLLPNLPFPVNVERIDSAHNPIRVVDEHHSDNSEMFNQFFSVTVTYGEIAELAERMKRAAREQAEAARQTLGVSSDIWEASRTRQELDPAINSPTGRRAAMNPAFAAPYTGATFNISINAPGGQLKDYGELELKILGMHSGQYLAAMAAQRRRRPRYDSPAGAHAGQFWLYNGTFGGQATTDGNARQRRRQIRVWKRQGFTVRQTNAVTGVTITR